MAKKKSRKKHKCGLAAASKTTRKRVSTAGVKARKKKRTRKRSARQSSLF